MTKDEALKLALEALEEATERYDIFTKTHKRAITAIKEALAQPELKDEKGRPMTYWGGMAQTEALKLALEHGSFPQGSGVIHAIKEALAQHDSVQAKPEPEQEPVAIMREMLEVQGQHGNWNYDSYMHGLYNGMEYMVALAEKREPQFRNAPDEWLAKYEVKRDNFNSTDPLTEATSSPPEPDWKGLVLAHNEDCESRCDKDRCGYARYFENNGRRCPTCPVYEKIDIDITPPQRKPLTEKIIMDSTRELLIDVRWPSTFIDVWRLCEAAHGIKE